MKVKIVVISMMVATMFISGCAIMTLTQQANQRRQEYVNAHPDLDQRTREAILAGKIFIGMNKEQVIASWGRPHDINRTVGSWGVHEQWVYGYTKYYGSGVSGFIPTHYLYFENGKLTSWQD